MRTIDLRRDTITLPTAEMKEAAFNATLGDSVYGEDDAQSSLESLAARKLGKERAIFVPSGTQGNLVALLSHTERGNEIITEENAHIRTSETGGAACVAGLMIKTVPGPDGAPDPDGVSFAIRKRDIHYPKTSLICLESTHYRYGGIVPPLEKFDRIRMIAKEHGIPIHLDGARIFNSSVSLGVEAKEIARFADSVMVSLSKGLGAPVGSMLCGSEMFIEKASRYRKMLGGGMRQTGWLCACGIVALSDENIGRLSADHENARLLARGLSQIEGFEIDLSRIHTNYVVARFSHPRIGVSELVVSLEEKGILVTPHDAGGVRCVVCREVDTDDISYTVETVKKIVQ
ncbi:MAG: aminotransferase class I/II-fold pyridoxal phosphate-dependent enzyme [Spirochaetes bacterium]|nr:aminotransferase class I/II-fold pyridoxal phosphate-dependent enzyme [Spirochaetota bacterium]